MPAPACRHGRARLRRRRGRRRQRLSSGSPNAFAGRPSRSPRCDGAWLLAIGTDCRLRSGAVSELQLTAATEIDARTARREHTERAAGLVDATHRLSHSYATGQGRVNSARVNKRLRMKDSFNPNQTTPKFGQIGPASPPSQFARLAGQQRHEAHRDQVLALDSPCPVLVSLTSSCAPPCGPSGSTMMPPSASCSISAGGMLSAAAVTMMRS